MAEPGSSAAGVVEQYEGLVRGIAGRIHRRLKLRVDVEDLVQLGMIGLLEAQERFDPAGGTTLSTFAYHRIRGRILDNVGTMTGLSRSRMRTVRRVQAAASYAESLAEASPARDADARSAADYVNRAVDGVVFASDFAELVDDRHAEDQDHVERGNPERLAFRKQLRESVADTLAELHEDEAFLLRAHYFSARSLADIGEEMGISRSWACRLHARALDNARDLLQARHGIEAGDVFRATRRR